MTSRYGQPTVYAPFEGGVAVGRSYREIFDTGKVRKVWRREALLDFLSSGTVVFPDGATFFEGVFEVPPGRELHVEGGDARISESNPLPDPSEELGEEILPLFREALIDSLGDIPEDAGLCLSGGLDSSAIAAAWSSVGNPGCFVYSVSNTLDEKLALETAEVLGTDPSVVKGDQGVSLEELENMCRILEIPIHIPLGPLPQFRLLSAMSRRGIKTVYTGQGGDEVLCGYPWHFPMAMDRLAVGDREKAELWRKAQMESPPMGVLTLRLVRRCFTRTSSWVNLNDGGACAVLGLSREEVCRRRGVRFFAADCPDWESVRRQDLLNRTLRYLLHYDVSLADHFGMEVRAPFLSDVIVDLVSRFRLDFLYGKGTLKYPLRTLFPEVPEKVRFNNVKTGFWHNGSGLPELMPSVKRMLEETSLGDLVKVPGMVDKMSPLALWRFYSAGVLLEDGGITA